MFLLLELSQGAHFFSAISDMNSVDEAESEDCLYLNIWTPYEKNRQTNQSGHHQSHASHSHRQEHSSKNHHQQQQKQLNGGHKAVLVYFHSGLFSFGTISSHDFDASNLAANHDIVVVTVQNRLGALGFASFQSDSSESKHTSLALSDQARALEWIHANIYVFGGDSKQITIAGHGSGAINVGAHLLNPATNHLFHRVIVQGIQNLWNIGIYGLNDRASRTLSDEMSCVPESSNNVSLVFLKKCAIKNKVKASSIVEYQHFLYEKHSVPFGAEFNPHTSRLIEMLKSNKTGLAPRAKPNISQLIELFKSWNIFPKHVQ